MLYIYIYINTYIYNTYYTYTYIKELCQQVFTYNEEVPCTSQTSCAQSGHLTSARFEHFVCH